jgi:hypothetical protein
MSNNTSCICGDCDDSLGLPIGATGEAGAPGSQALSYIIGGAPFISVSTTYQEVGRIVFSNAIADPFTAVKNNVWMSGGTGSLKISDLATGNTIYENTNITATTAYNIETATGISAYNAAASVIVIEVKTQNIANTISIGSTLFYYA